MRRIYRIHISHESGNPELATTEFRYRADSAEDRCYALVHALLRSNSLFGTPLSERVMREVDNLNAYKGGDIDLGHGFRLYLTPSHTT